ncbi:MAG TPA: DUF1127 domain-containing protein [Xanthobacteraceae bacterium]|nr:DUF1127 domain-containing protein [Xanthobacteraceae bacterium]
MTLFYVIASLIRSVRRYNHFRTVYAELETLDDRELADLGVSRFDFSRIAREAANEAFAEPKAIQARRAIRQQAVVSAH